MSLLRSLHAIRPQSSRGMFSSVAAGVSRLGVVFVNLYVVDLPGGKWALVDTGVPASSWYVLRAVESRYGAGARPVAIVLTHGHFDHSGNARELAETWNVPVYAHALELPYLTGRSDYPPQDPTIGGAISFMSRFFPRHSINLGPQVRPVPQDGSIPEMPGWRWVHTPGHTAGHVSLFRERDATLIAGDAVITTNLDAWSSQLTWPREISRPPTPLTPDWSAARESIRRLAALSPRTLTAGHGLPMTGPNLAQALATFAAAMPEPEGGRYEHDPAQYAADGSVSAVPAPVPDPLPLKLALAAAVVAAAGVVIGIGSRRRARDRWS